MWAPSRASPLSSEPASSPRLIASGDAGARGCRASSGCESTWPPSRSWAERAMSNTSPPRSPARRAAFFAYTVRATGVGGRRRTGSTAPRRRHRYRSVSTKATALLRSHVPGRGRRGAAVLGVGAIRGPRLEGQVHGVAHPTERGRGIDLRATLERLDRRLHVFELLALHLAQALDHLGEGVEEVRQLVATPEARVDVQMPIAHLLEQALHLEDGPCH